MPDQGRLLVEAEWKGEVDELATSARASRLGSKTLDTRRCGLDERGVGRSRPIRGNLDAKSVRPSNCHEVHGRCEPRPVRRGVEEPDCAEAAERSAVGGEEDDGVRGTDRRPRSSRAWRGAQAVAAGQLQERAGAGGVVVRALARAQVVPMRHDDEHLRGASRRYREDVLEADPSHGRARWPGSGRVARGSRTSQVAPPPSPRRRPHPRIPVTGSRRSMSVPAQSVWRRDRRMRRAASAAAGSPAG